MTRAKQTRLTILKVIGSTAVALIICFAVMVAMVLGISPKIPSDPSQVHNDICLHYSPNSGSGEEYYIFSYYCDAEPDWRELYLSGPFSEEALETAGVLDMTYTMECPMIYVDGNTLHIHQNKICKWFAHPNPEPDYMQLYIHEDGEIEIVEPVHLPE